MKRTLYFIRLIILIFFIIFIYNINIFAYEEYKKKDVIIFSIYSKIPNVPDSVLQGLNNSIENIFASSKRFNVYYYPQFNLDLNYLNDLILKIKQIRENTYSGKSDSVFGNLVVSYDDLYKFSNSFYIVISNLSFFSQYIDKSGDNPKYVCEMIVNLKILNVEDLKIEGDILINKKSYSLTDISEAEVNSISSIKEELRNKIYSLDMFRLVAGILKREGSIVYVSLGDMVGIVPGHEFLVIGKEQIGDKFIEKEVGLIRIKSVSKDVAIGIILIENQKITEGDQIKEYVRTGVKGIDNSYYLSGIKVDIPYNIYADNKTLSKLSYLIGGGSSAKSYIDFNKYLVVGIEGYLYNIPFINYFAGFGISLYFYRIIFSLEGNGSLFDMGIYSQKDSYYSRTIGLRGILNIEFLLSPFSSILIKGGYLFCFPYTQIIYRDSNNNEYKYNLANPININGIFISFCFNLRL